MVHWCCRETSEAKHAPLVVGIDERLDRVSIEERVSLGSGDAQRPAELRGINRLALREFPVQCDRRALFFGRKTRQVRLQHLPIRVKRWGLGHLSETLDRPRSYN